MRKINAAHLFVEKYTKDYLLVDFVQESEFIYFRNNGDYVEGMTLSGEYEPTMLLFTNVGVLPLKEGDLFSVPMNFLIDAKNAAHQNQFYEDIKEMPMNLFMVFSNGALITELFERNHAHNSNRSLRKYEKEIEESWAIRTPCSLDELGSNFVLEVVDVGQGSTNLIYDDNSLTIFDCGTSMSYPKSVCHNILSKMEYLFDQSKTISLIISHWDCDHYNLLTVMDDDLLRRFCCVFVPFKVISLTAQNAVKRIYKNCYHIKTFKPMSRTQKRKNGIQPVITKNNYELYVGEKSSSINKSGLALVVKGDADIAILCADHSNYQIWDCIYPRIIHSYNSKLHIVVPHHGGNCGKTSVKHLAVQAGVAAISVGKNTYKHPQQGTIDKYEDLGFEIKRTDWERKNIVIKMQ